MVLSGRLEKTNFQIRFHFIKIIVSLIDSIIGGRTMNYDAWDEEYLEEIEAINDILNIK